MATLCSASALVLTMNATARDGGIGEEGPGERQARGTAAVREFRRANPCPATGQTRGACPGWQVDHVQALVCGGRDEPANLQWLTAQEHREKTRRDMRGCRARDR